MVKLILPSALIMLTNMVAAAQAEVFEQAFVRGAKVIAEEDILLTCGNLTGVELSEYDYRDIESCLKSTGVFDDVKVMPQGDTLVIEVAEVPTKPGRLDIGVAWNSDGGLSGQFDYSQYDLIPNSYLSMYGSFGREIKSYGFEVLREDAFGEGLHFGFSIEGQATDYDDTPYDSDVDQVEARLIWGLSDSNFRSDFGIGYRSQKVFAFEAGASPLFRDSAGRITAPFLRLGFTYDYGSESEKLQSNLSLDQYVWNLGTDDRILDLRLTGDLQYQLDDDYKILMGFSGGVALPRDGNQLSVLDRANLGGNSLRGFAPRGIGPSDGDDLLGGMRYLAFSVEAQREITLFDDKSFTGGVFADFGSVWGLTNTDAGRVDDAFNLRSSLGVSATFNIAEVPVSLYLAKPLKKQEQDDTQYFGIMLQAKF